MHAPKRGPRWQIHTPRRDLRISVSPGNPAPAATQPAIPRAGNQRRHGGTDRRDGTGARVRHHGHRHGLGHKHTLKQKVKDPETGEDVWVEHKPDLAWFKMIVATDRASPQQRHANARLSAILDNIDRKHPDPEDQGKAAESPEPSQSASADKPFHVVGPSGAWVPAGEEKAESTGTLFQDVPANAGNGLQSPLAARHSPPPGRASARRRRPGRAPGRPGGSSRRRPRHDLGGGTTVLPARRRSWAVFSNCSIRPGMLSGSRRSLMLSLRDCSRETSAALLPDHPGPAPIGRRARPGAGGDRRRGLLPALYQAVVLDDQRAGGHVVQAGDGHG